MGYEYTGIKGEITPGLQFRPIRLTVPRTHVNPLSD